MTGLQKWNEPQDMAQAMKLAEWVTKSAMCPQGFRNRPRDALVAMAHGAELGLTPIASLQNMAVINGKPSIYGDALMALVRKHPDCEWVKEECDGTKAVCTVKRKGAPEESRTFTVDMAKNAKLWGRKGPWTDYPERMLQMRARSWALRDVFADALAGFITREEAEDFPAQEEVKPAEVIREEKPELAQLAQANQAATPEFMSAATRMELERLASEFYGEEALSRLETLSMHVSGQGDYVRLSEQDGGRLINGLKQKLAERDDSGCNAEVA